MAAEPIDREAIIEANAQTRESLLAAIAGVPEPASDELWVDDWRLSDTIAHLAGAQAGYAEALEHIAKGEPPAIEGWEPGPPHDWNATVVAARRDRTWGERLADLDTARERHEATVRAVPAATFDAPEAGFPHQFSTARNSAEHYAANVTRHEGAHVRRDRRTAAGTWAVNTTVGVFDLNTIIEQNAQARAELVAAIDALPADRRLEPGLLGEWSLKDVLVHIAGWQENAETVLGILAAGGSLDGDFDTDAYNAVTVAEHADETWDEVLGWMRRAREAYDAAAREAVERSSAEQLAPGAIVDRVLRSNGAEHDREHVAQILAWRKEQGL